MRPAAGAGVSPRDEPHAKGVLPLAVVQADRRSGVVPFQLNEPLHYTDVTPTKAYGESLRVVGTARD